MVWSTLLPSNRSLVRSLILISLTWLLSSPCTAQLPADPVDAERAERYVASLRKLEESRVLLRERAASLLAQNPNLEQELVAALQAEFDSAGALRNTPRFEGIPSLLQTFHLYRGQSGELLLQPRWLLWYALQDNTLLRQQLMFTLFDARRTATRSYVALENRRLALEQIAQSADENFADFRQLADIMGRRSTIELQASDALTTSWLADDPLNAGATLVNAQALRASGRFDQCNQLLAKLSSNFPIMDSISQTVAGQIAYLKGDVKESQRLLERAVSQARASGTTEAYLIRGWLAMANQKWSDAQSQAARARQMQANPTSQADVEVAILESLATAYERPTRSRQGLVLLRRAQLNVSADDWQYFEAMAILHAMANDKQFAKREIDNALKQAPSFIRPELEKEKTAIDAGQIPQIDWQARLKLLWQRP